MTTEEMQLSPDQAEAIEKIAAWWETGEQVFSLAGYAGTGKTTVISRLLGDWPTPVVVGAPTGKAAARLREKGVKAATIHQLAYRFTHYDENGDPVFDYEGLTADKNLVVIDEASMVNQAIYDDLIGGGYRMLFVGDHGQLAPVGGDPGIMRNPTYALSVIHRQDDQGLLAFAHAMREGAWLPDAEGAVDTLRGTPLGSKAGEDEILRDADTVICWRNKTRHWLNHRIMVLHGLIPAGAKYRPESPPLESLVGKEFRVVVLRNNSRQKVFNGQVFDFDCAKMVGDRFMRGHLDCGDGMPPQEVEIVTDGFSADAKGVMPDGNMLLADFGYCLTAHKSQGSEWPWVAVYDDTYQRMEGRARWAYTAATRAKERLTWIHR